MTDPTPPNSKIIDSIFFQRLTCACISTIFSALVIVAIIIAITHNYPTYSISSKWIVLSFIGGIYGYISNWLTKANS